jgi:hypothetical protein
MGGMSMGGLPPLANFPQYYWAVVGTVIAIATLVNVYNHLLCRQRYAVRQLESAQLTLVGSLPQGQVDYTRRDQSHGSLGEMQPCSPSCEKRQASRYVYLSRIAF